MSVPQTDIRPITVPPEKLLQLLNEMDSEMRQAKREGRRSRRYTYRTCGLTVHVLDGLSQGVRTSFHVSTRNISTHGLAFLHRNAMSPGQLFRIEIPALDEGRIVVHGRVVRCRYVRDMVHEIGVEFVNLPGQASTRPSAERSDELSSALSRPEPPLPGDPLFF